MIGRTGQLGQSLESIAALYAEYEFVFVGREQFDMEGETEMHTFFENYTFDIIINCAAYTSVDKAETDQHSANSVNNIAVLRLSKVAKKYGIKLIHISTDYVFNGKSYRPYRETEKVDPLSVYGKTKLEGENAILRVLPTNAIILRTSWLFSEYGNNFLKTMLKLGQRNDKLNIVSDQVSTPTYAKDLAKTIMIIIQSHLFEQNSFKTSIYNFSNEGVCSWFDFSKVIFDIAAIKCNVHPIETKDYPTPATRPYYSVLNKNKIKENFNVTIPFWKDSVKKCLVNLMDQSD